MKLLLIRHGESVGNAERRIQGQTDFPLTDRGRDQARALAQRLCREGWAITAIYASDLSRAAETAEIISATLDVPVALDQRLREYDAGVLNGIIWREVEHLYPDLWHAFHHSDKWVHFPESEGNETFVSRLSAALADIQGKHSEVVAVVSHGGSLGMLLTFLLGMDTERPAPFRFGNASLSLVEFGVRGPFLSLLNDTYHLEGDLR
ncbi:MAG: histidine phosphatase family protein [Anaerolineae bacterium]|jgi:broad specificity phosphatase PhoE